MKKFRLSIETCTLSEKYQAQDIIELHHILGVNDMTLAVLEWTTHTENILMEL